MQDGTHLVEEALVVHGLAGGAHVGLAESDLLADVALAIARQLALLHAMRVARIQPPLALAFPPPLLPARTSVIIASADLIVHDSQFAICQPWCRRRWYHTAEGQQDTPHHRQVEGTQYIAKKQSCVLR